MKNSELINITGGAISSTLLNSLARLIGVFFEIGQVVGSSIRRIKNNNKC